MEDKTNTIQTTASDGSLIISETKRDLNRLQKIISDATRSKMLRGKK